MMTKTASNAATNASLRKDNDFGSHPPPAAGKTPETVARYKRPKMAKRCQARIKRTHAEENDRRRHEKRTQYKARQDKTIKTKSPPLRVGEEKNRSERMNVKTGNCRRKAQS